LLALLAHDFLHVSRIRVNMHHTENLPESKNNRMSKLKPKKKKEKKKQ
jgi:hypothetical protein